MLSLLLLLSSPTSAAEVEQELAWDLQIDGQSVGTRTLKVKYDAAPTGTVRRILEFYAEITGDLLYQQRVTGHAGLQPASFHAVSNLNGEPLEVQARMLEEGWRVAINQQGQSKTYDLPDSRIDLSTVDLFDPSTTVPISRYESARVLSAETAEILEGEVTRMGPSDLVIQGQQITVEEYLWEPPGERLALYYTADGFLVKYEMPLGEHRLTAILKEPPPEGVDDAPVPLEDANIEVIEL